MIFELSTLGLGCPRVSFWVLMSWGWKIKVIPKWVFNIFHAMFFLWIFSIITVLLVLYFETPSYLLWYNAKQGITVIVQRHTFYTFFLEQTIFECFWFQHSIFSFLLEHSPQDSSSHPVIPQQIMDKLRWSSSSSSWISISSQNVQNDSPTEL